MKTRVISAIIALCLLIAAIVFFQERGIECFCFFAAAVSVFEYCRMTFGRFDSPLHVEVMFGILCISLFFVTFMGLPSIALVFGPVASVIMIAVILMTVRSGEDLPIVLQLQACAVMGLFYCGVCTGLVTRLVTLDRGEIWFLGLLAIVFAGDTFAYLAGRAFGRHKLLEPVSPKKTIEGSMGGLVGSTLAGGLLGHFFLPEFPLVGVILMAFVTGAFAQVGDLFESLIKRVADVKDSGRIMPGHGGVLDRLDGVLFAAPVYFALISVLR